MSHHLLGSEAASREQRDALVQRLRDGLADHIKSLHLEDVEATGSFGNGAKALIRASHAAHRLEFLRRAGAALRKHLPKLAALFPQGREIRPEQIDPEVGRVRSAIE